MATVRCVYLRELLLICFTVITLVSVTEAFLSCGYGQFRCFNEKCVPWQYFCNGQNNCGDNSDSMYCNIQANIECPVQGMPWRRCKDKSRCYPAIWRCNGRSFCRDGSDEEGCIQGMTGVINARKILIQRFENIRQSKRSINKWNPHLLRTAVALYLAEPYTFAPGNKTGEEMAYEVSLKMMAKLSLRRSIPTQMLSLFINALMVSCINPRDFFGVNLIEELRTRADKSAYVNPFTILTLCNAEDKMTQNDVSKVLSAYSARHRPLWTDMQAVSTMALACLSTRPEVNIPISSINRMTDELKRKQKKNGTIDDLKTTALVVQALLATDSHRNSFDLNGAIKYLVESVNKSTIEEAYYMLPVFSTTSLMNVTFRLCSNPIKTDLEVLRDLKDIEKRRIPVQFSIFVGNDMDLIRSWKLKVPENYTFYDVLETVGSIEPQYKVRYNVFKGKPYVSAISKFADDAVIGMFWFIYTHRLQSDENPVIVQEKSPVDIHVKKNKELILWYRSGTWHDPYNGNDDDDDVSNLTDLSTFFPPRYTTSLK